MDLATGAPELPFMSWENALALDPAFPSITGTPSSYTFQQNSTSPPATLYLVPMSDTTYPKALQAGLILRPTVAAAGLDSYVLNRYKDAIVYGAASRLCLMSKQIWSSMKDAQLYGQLARKGINDAYSEGLTANGSGVQTVQIRKFR